MPKGKYRWLCSLEIEQFFLWDFVSLVLATRKTCPLWISRSGARHPHSLGTRSCGWSATFPELRLEMKMTNLGVSTLQHTAVGAGSFQSDSIIKLWSVTINPPSAGWRESVIWKTVRIHCLAMSLGRKWNDGTRDTFCFNDTFHASFASAK